MADNEKIVLGVAVDASAVKPALDGVARDAGAMAQKVVAAGKDAGTGLEQIGVSAGKSAQQTKRELKSITDQIQRVQIDLATAGKSASDALQIKANIKGIDISTLKAQIDALKAMELAQNGATGSLKTMGVSAGQTRMALQQLPMQFSDIAVSLQGGQKPLTVFLQQGSQLKDAFGGAGAALKAMTGYVLGMVNPFTVAAAAAGTLAIAYYQGGKEAENYNKALILSGNIAGTTTAKMTDMARALGDGKYTQSAAASAIAELAQSGAVAGDRLQKFAAIAIDVERATGQAISKTAESFKDLEKAPLEATIKLNDSLHYLTLGVYEQIKALTEQGRTTDAARLAMDSYAEAMGTRAKQVTENAGALEKSWKAVGSTASWAWDKMLGIGRDATGSEQLANLKKTLADREARGPLNSAPGMAESYEKGNKALRDQIGLLERIGGAQQKSAEASAAQLKTTEAKTVWDKESEKFLSKQQQLKREILKTEVEGQALLAKGAITQKEYAERLSNVRDKYKETAKAAQTTGETEVASIRAKVIETQRYIDTMKAQGLEAAKQTEGEKLVVKIQQELEGGLKGVARANKEKALAAAQSLAGVQKESAAIEALLKAQQAFEVSRDKEIAGQEASILKMEEKALAMEDQVRMYGMSKEALESLSIARLQERADILAGFAGSSEQVALIEKEIDARKRLAVAANQKDGLDAGVKAAKEAESEWKRTAASIENTMTDALMRAFEGGKGFARAMRDTIVNMFKTMVLRPIVQAVMSPVSAAIGGTLGLSGAANAATGGGSGMLSGLGTLGSLTSGVGLLGAGGLGLQAGFGALMSGGFAGIGAAVTGGMASIGAGTGASIAAGLGTIAGALGPIALGAYAVYSLLGNKGKPTSSTGESQIYFDAAGRQASQSDLTQRDYYNAAGNASADEFVKGLQASYTRLAASIGAKAVAASFGYGGNTGKGGESPNFALSGAAGASSFYQGETKITDGAIQLAASRAVFAAVQGSELPQYLKGAFDGMAAGSMTAEQITGALAGAQAVKTFHDQVQTLPAAFDSFKDLSFTALQAMGGLDVLGAKLSSYYDNFFTDEEKALNTRKNIAGQLNAVGIGFTADDLAKLTRPEFRKWYEDIATEFGADNPMALALLNVSDAFASVTPVIDTVAAAVGAGVTTISEAMRRLSDDTASLQIELLRAQGNGLGADAAQRTLDTSSLTAAEVAIYDYNQSLRSQIAALNDASAASSAAVQAQKQAAQAVASQRASLQDQLNALTDTAAQALTRQRDALDESNRPLFDQINALSAQKDAVQAAMAAAQAAAAAQTAAVQAAYQLAKDGSVAALEGVRRAIAAEKERIGIIRDAARESVTSISGVFDLLKTQVSQLYGTVSSTATMQASDGNAFIDQALSALRSTGDLPDQQGLADAIAGARGGLDANSYASQFEADKAALVMAGKLSQLQVASGYQLTAAEQALKVANDQLTALDKQLDYAQQQINALDGINASVLTIPAALAALEASIGTVTAARAAVAAATAPVSGSGGVLSGAASYSQAWVVGEIAKAQAEGYSVETILAGGQSNYGVSAADIIAVARRANLPGFAVGTNYVPRDMVAQIHEGEAIVPKAYNPAAGGTGSSGNDRLERLVEGLTAEVQRLQAIVATGNANTRRTADAVNGNPEVPMMVQTV